jgi:hypothetical protein
LVFEKIKFFADVYKAHIHLLKVITPKDFESTPYSQSLINNFIKNVNLKNFTINIYNETSIETGIIDFAEAVNADLIAMETHGRTGFAHLINGSIAEEVVKHEPKPVLSVKIQPIPLKTLAYNLKDLRKGIFADENWLPMPGY